MFVFGKTDNTEIQMPQKVPLMVNTMFPPPMQVQQEAVHLQFKQSGPKVHSASVARRDPRLARYIRPARPSPSAPAPTPSISPTQSNVIDHNSIGRVTKRKHAITIELQPDEVHHAPCSPMWRDQQRPKIEHFPPNGLGFYGTPLFCRPKLDQLSIRPPCGSRIQMPLSPPLPTPKTGMQQGECPLLTYERVNSPALLGIPGVIIPPTDIRVLEYIDQDPVKTIQIDDIPREIRFYGETAVIMLDWDDPREIKFLPGSRRVTFDNKSFVAVSFNDGYQQVKVDNQTFYIKFGAPTRELYINGRWFECFFGGQPIGALIDGRPLLIHLEGPSPQIDIGKVKRTDLCAGRINIIVDEMHTYPIFLDAKVQKFVINGNFFSIRFVDALRTVLINEMPFEVEFGGLPKSIFIGNTNYFIRFSELPRHVKPGFTHIVNMEGQMQMAMRPYYNTVNYMEKDEAAQRPMKTPTPDGISQGPDVLASLVPSGIPPSALQSSTFENISMNGNILNKLAATGIVKTTNEMPVQKTKIKEEMTKYENYIHQVDLLKPESLRIKQPGLISQLYGGRQCSGCDIRFPPEQMCRYSQHLDWHFQENRRIRDSATLSHSRPWLCNVADWCNEELKDLKEKKKSSFEIKEVSVAAGEPGERHCALCGDTLQQFFNDDDDEWHLRDAVRHEGNVYHPMCLKDYKASQIKVEKSQRCSQLKPRKSSGSTQDGRSIV